MQYSQDYDERYPNLSGNNGAGIPQVLGPYSQKVAGYSATGNGTNIWTCPSDSLTRVPVFGASNYPAGSEIPKQSYGVVYWTATNAAEHSAWPGSGEGRSISSFADSANTFLLAELRNDGAILGQNSGIVKRPASGGALANAGYAEQDCIDANCTKFAPAPHLETWIYLYVDGHAKAQRADRTIGQGVSGSGKNTAANGGTACSFNTPCGPWTIDESD